MRRPLAQKMGKVFDRGEDLAVQTEPVGGLGSAYGFDRARKEPLGCYLCRISILRHMFYYEKPFQAQLGVMEFLDAPEWTAF